MKVSSISVSYPKPQMKYSSSVRKSEQPNPSEPTVQANVNFGKKMWTKVLGGISGVTAIVATVATGGAALGIAALYTAVCTAIGYSMDKENDDL